MRAKNGNNSLVIGSTVKNANTINGLSQPGINAINSLLSTNGTNAGIESFRRPAWRASANEGDVRRAGEQLAPEANFATQQAAITLAFLTGRVHRRAPARRGRHGSERGRLWSPIWPRRGRQLPASALRVSE